MANPSKYLISYLESQGVIMPSDVLVKEEFVDCVSSDTVSENNYTVDNSYVQNGVNPNVNSNMQYTNYQVTPNMINATNINSNI
jgi:hypothetical protein